MSVTYADRVQETFTTIGTGIIALGGAVVGYQAFGSALADSQTCYYAATDGTNWEVGLGTYTASGDTLTRTTILASSNAGNAVSWLTGTKNIWLDLPAYTLQNNNFSINQINQLAIESSETYVPTTGMVYTIVKICGGGGSGAANNGGGGGGGAGATLVGFYSAAEIGASQSIIIGAGGAGVSGSAGNNGSATSFGSLMSANGGAGGIASSSPANFVLSAGGAGATATTGGLVAYPGQGGGAGFVVDVSSSVAGISGAGGNSNFAGGGQGVVGSGNVDGHSGGPGAGGSGAMFLGTSGAGGNGLVKITEFIAAAI